MEDWQKLQDTANRAFKQGIQHAIFVCDAYEESYPEIDLSDLKEILRKEIAFADLE